MEQPSPSRRQFIAAIGNLASAAWITMNWPQIAVAAAPAEHAGHDSAVPAGALATLSPTEWRQLIEIVVTGYCDTLREFAAQDRDRLAGMAERIPF